MSHPTLSLLILVACGGGGDPAPAPAPAPAPVDRSGWVGDVAELPQVREVLAPSPLALRAEITAAGLDITGLVPQAVPAQVHGSDPDAAALHTGALFSHALLGGATTDKAVFVEQLRGLRAGLGVIAAKPEHLTAADRTVEAVVNDSASREDVLAQLDVEVQALRPTRGDTRPTGPLLQAGAWLAGIHVVALAVERSGDDALAEKLLRRPEVAGFFLEYMRAGDGSQKAGAMTDAVVSGLKELKAITARDHLGVEDAREIADVTGRLLALM